MNAKLIYFVVAVFVILMSGKCYSIDKVTETIIESDLALYHYTSGISFNNDDVIPTYSHVKHGYEVIHRGDGTCYKKTTFLWGMQKFNTSVPGLFIEAPKTETIIKEVSCNFVNKN